jgi:hypothetical protein
MIFFTLCSFVVGTSVEGALHSWGPVPFGSVRCFTVAGDFPFRGICRESLTLFSMDPMVERIEGKLSCQNGKKIFLAYVA